MIVQHNTGEYTDIQSKKVYKQIITTECMMNEGQKVSVPVGEYIISTRI